MNFVRALILLGIVSLSWIWVHHDPQVSEVIHLSIQDELKKYFSGAIRKKFPDLQSVKFVQIWTESAGENNVRAHFKYSIQRKSVSGSTEVTGHALLESQESQTQWLLKDLVIANSHTIFKEGMIFRSTDNE